jgi:hypothetical protein
MEQPELVEVVYKREGREQTFTGYTRIGGVQDFTFAGADFNRVLEFASDALKRAPGHRLMMKRAEAPYPMPIPANVEELLRTDLPAAIRALSIGAQRVEVGGPRMRVYQGLRRGYDTMADSLGEEVFLRARAGTQGMLVENPASGRWVTAFAGAPQNHLVMPGSLRELFIGPFHGPWTSVKTEDLLALGQERYYLPRNWNPSAGWITHDLLAYMYDMYKKEKSDVIDS